MDRANPRIKDVAIRAGVATGTVSNVLNNPERVAESTRSRVEAAIAELGFVRNSAARTLVSGRSTSIGVVLTDLENSLFVDIARGSEDAATAAGFHVLLANSDSSSDRQESYVGLFEESRAAGLLLAPIEGPIVAALGARSRRLPVVLVNAPVVVPDICSVRVDEESGGRSAARHLLELGARRLVYLAGYPQLSAIKHRLIGIHRAVDEASAELEVVDAPDLSIATGRDYARRILQAGPVDGIICPSDNLAIGVIQAAAGLGLAVPDDLLVIGYDNNHFASETRVPVSTISQPGRQMGEAAFGLLLEEINQTADHQHRTITLAPRLIARQSTNRSAG